jgi:hypothetical protein
MAIITLNNNSLINADVGKVLQVVQPLLKQILLQAQHLVL